jgi:hypothetical protein
LQLDEVAELLGISSREMRSLRGTAPARPTKASGPMKGSVSDRMNASVVLEAQAGISRAEVRDDLCDRRLFLRETVQTFTCLKG